MSHYEEEIYKFITEKDNFEIAAEIHELFPKVRQKIITKFWEDIKVAFHKKDIDNIWEFDIELQRKRPIIWVYKKGWEASFAIENIYQEPWFGIHIEDTIIDKKKALDIISKNSKIKNLSSMVWDDDPNWLCWEKTSDNYDNISEIKSILFDGGSAVIDWVKWIYELINATEKDLLEINKTCRK